MKKIILGFTGEMACGKGTATKYLTKKYQANSYRFSTMLRDVLGRLYLDESRENMQRISTVLRQNFSEDLMAKVITEDVKNDKGEVIIIDGIRRMADIKFLSEISEFKFVYIDVNLEKRYERMKLRNEKQGDDEKSLEDFKKENEQESELQIKDLKDKADFVVDNDGSLEEFYSKINELIKNN